MWRGNKFIVVEGIDGVGKSTVCKALQEIVISAGYSCEMLYGVPSPYYEIAQKVPEVPSVYSRYFFYHACNIAVSDMIRGRLRFTNVILDRFAFSTYAYHAARGAELSFPVFSEDRLLEPDLSVILTVKDEKIRRCRLSARSEAPTIDDREERGPGSFIEKLEAAFEQLRLVSVDNSLDDPAVAARRIFDLVCVSTESKS